MLPFAKDTDSLCKVGWGRTQADAGFGGRDDSGTKARTVDLIASVRTVMRSMAHDHEGLERQALLTQVERSTIDSDKYDHHFIRTRSGLGEDRSWRYGCFIAWGRIEKVLHHLAKKIQGSRSAAHCERDIIHGAGAPDGIIYPKELRWPEIDFKVPHFPLNQTILAVLCDPKCHPWIYYSSLRRPRNGINKQNSMAAALGMLISL